MGAIAWGTIIFAIPRVDYKSGFKLGSADKDIVLHFQATSSRDYWEITYTTSGYYAVIYKFDECNYANYVEGRPLNPYETLINDQNAPLKLKLNSSNCKGSSDIYIVWNFWKGTGITVEYEAKEAHFFSAIGVIIYFSVGLTVFGIGLLKTTDWKGFKQRNMAKRVVKLQHKKSVKLKRGNLTKCASCGKKISLIAEYCVYCGTETPFGKHNKSKIDYDAFNVK